MHIHVLFTNSRTGSMEVVPIGILTPHSLKKKVVLIPRKIPGEMLDLQLRLEPGKAHPEMMESTPALGIPWF